MEQEKRDMMLYSPTLNADFCTNEEFAQAVAVIADCYREAAPDAPMSLGYFTPGAGGAHYGNNCWSLDYALTVDGAKWLNPTLAADLVYNLRRAQEPDGRVKLYTADAFGHIPNVKEPVASLPKYFESVFDASKMFGDPQLTATAYDLLRNSLHWWYENRFDAEAGLFSALFEETFVPNTVSSSRVYAPVDTNTEILLGLENAAALASALGKAEDRDAYIRKAQALREAANRYLWCEEDGCCYPYMLTEKRHYKALMASTFNGFYFLPADRQARLLDLLHDHEAFNWEGYALTSMAKNDPLFTTTERDYKGNLSWSGSVWTLTNMAAIKALLRAGYTDDARELALKTVACFKGNYTELVNPFTRSGEGVLRYGWTAGQFIQIIIEVLFGISYTAEGGLSVNPLLKPSTACSMTNLILPNGQKVNVSIGDEVRVEYM